MSGHKWCEPPYYPKSLDEHWTCPECGLEYVAFEPTSSFAIGLGWKTARP